MKCFAVLSCVLAIICGVNSFKTAALGGSRFGSYGARSGAAVAQSVAQSQEVASDSFSSSSESASSEYEAGGYSAAASDYAGGYDARSAGFAGAGYGAVEEAAGGYGVAGAAASGYGVAGAASGFASNAASAGYANNAASSSFAKRSASSFSRSSSSRSSSYSARSHSASFYAEQWGELYQQYPLFQSLCNVKSTLKSQELASTIINNSYDYGSIVSQLYAKNHILQKYLTVATGIRYSASQRTQFFSLIKQQPVYALRLINIFARNPQIFTSPFGQFIVNGKSAELFETYQRSVSTYSYNAFVGSPFLTSLVKSKYYTRSLVSLFGLQSFDESVLLTKIGNFYRTNPYGTLLLLRHVLARRQVTSLQPYFGCTGISQYRSQYSSIWARKSWRRNTYYSTWSRQYSSRSSSYSAASSNQFSRSAASYGAASAGAAAAASSYEGVAC